MKEDIQKILEAAVNAPSGSNSQPWRFEVSGSEIKVIALPEKDHPILNYRNRGTLIAHGALIENISITSSVLGYKANVNLFPDTSNPKLIARIGLEQNSPSSNPLYKCIPLRSTNRKPYKRTPIT